MPATKTMCSVCNLTLNSYDQFMAHKSGRAHKRKETLALGGGPTASAAQSGSAPVVKIVRPNSFIQFVSGQNSNSSSSQNIQNGSGTCGEIKIGESAQSGTNMSTTQQNNVFCHTCVVKLTSQAHADMHYAGLKHKRAIALTVSGTSGETRGEGIKRKIEEICEVCNVPLVTKVVAEAHYAGSKHTKKLKLSQNISQDNPCLSVPAVSLAASHPSQKVQPANVFFCNYCKVTLNSQMQMDAHKEGLKHNCKISGIVQKKTFKPIQPQEQNRFLKPPEHNRPYVKLQEPNRYQEQGRFQEQNRFQEESRFVSPGHFQTGNYGNPTGPMQFRAGVSVAYPPQYY